VLVHEANAPKFSEVLRILLNLPAKSQNSSLLEGLRLINNLLEQSSLLIILGVNVN
jgi:hypothetical protein